MAKRKTASTRKAAKPKGKPRTGSKAPRSRSTARPGRRGAKKVTRKPAARKPATRKAPKKTAQARPSKKATVKGAPRRVARAAAPPRPPAKQTRPAKARPASRQSSAPPSTRPSPRTGGTAPPRSVPSPLFSIVDEPDDDLRDVTATSSLDLDHRPRLPIALAELEEDRPVTRRGDATLKAGDEDADSERAYFTGDETPGGENPTPDQDVVDFIGRSLGVEYDDDEELRGAEKIAERDRHRWELDPASAEGPTSRRR